jgi:hypothetical protein
VIVGATSPEEAWSKLLLAMRNGAPVEPFATPAGIASLEHGVRDEPRAQAFARWGSGWAAWEVRWKARTGESAEALLGPEVKEHGLRFVRTPDGWKLDRWTPGE